LTVEATQTRTSDLLDRRNRAVARGVSAAHPLFVARAEGARLWDVDGREFVDFAGGIGVLNAGHRHPAVVAAVRAQLDAFTHTCFQVGMYEGYVALAERLNALAPGAFAKKTLLLTTGAEATENAVKIARGATGRPAVIAFSYGYHGRTLLALTMTGKVAPYKQNFGPFAPEVYQAPYPDAGRGYDTERALQALDELFETRVAPKQVAAFIIEPVLGEGGFVPAPFDFLRELRARADRHGIVLIADEVQTGFGRTGTMFAIEQSGVAPDLLTFAKSVAGGLPLSGVVGRAEIMDAVEPGGLGGTYAGNPLACAAALATLAVFDDEALLERAQLLGRTLRGRLEALRAAYPAQILAVRGLGAMLGIVFAQPADGGKSLASRVVAAAFDEGLVALTAGPKAEVLRILVPLVATGDDLARGFGALERACARVLEPQPAAH
jgi:4-aminobutyrate aminotransferase/(S)-3-amino-2-methylpropionate transaminase